MTWSVMTWSSKALIGFGLCIATTVLTVKPAGAADIQAGRSLHEKSCVACHASLTQGKPSEVYTRADRRVKSHDALVAQVRRCAATVGPQWSEKDITNVAAFLDATFYKF